MRWIFALLALANIGLYLWGLRIAPPPGVNPPPGAPTLFLLSERDALAAATTFEATAPESEAPAVSEPMADRSAESMPAASGTRPLPEGTPPGGEAVAAKPQSATVATEQVEVEVEQVEQVEQVEVEQAEVEQAEVEQAEPTATAAALVDRPADAERAQPLAQPAVAAEPLAPERPPASSATAPAEMTVIEASQSARRCWRLGPFDDDGLLSAAEAALRVTGIAPVRSEQSERVENGFWVLIPPLENRAAAIAMEERLRADGISDVWRVPRGELAHALSLGLFNTRGYAERRADALRGQGYTVEVQPRLQEQTRRFLSWSDAAPAGSPPLPPTAVLPADTAPAAVDCPPVEAPEARP